MRLMFIHGRAQGGKSPAELSPVWIHTLKAGFKVAGRSFPDALAVDFPFYANTLDDFVSGANLPTPADVAAKGAGQNTQFEQFMQSALGEIQTAAAISDNEIGAHLDGTAPQEKGPQNWAWVQALARAIDNRFRGAATFTIEAFLKDVYLYVYKPAVTKAIDAIVEAKLTQEPTIVLAHSLGSVVGYNVIKRNLPRIKLVKYITVGCPLGLRAISSKLGLAENPGGPDGWYNAYDPCDVRELRRRAQSNRQPPQHHGLPQ
jgi:hypothetical protein